MELKEFWKYWGGWVLVGIALILAGASLMLHSYDEPTTTQVTTTTIASTTTTSVAVQRSVPQPAIVTPVEPEPVDEWMRLVQVASWTITRYEYNTWAETADLPPMFYSACLAFADGITPSEAAADITRTLGGPPELAEYAMTLASGLCGE